MTERKRMTISDRIRRPKFMVLLTMLFPLLSHSQQNQASPDLRALINGINQTYMIPNGFDYSTLAAGSPSGLAAVIGHAMRQQRVFFTQRMDPVLERRFNDLAGEVRAYMGAIAAACNYTDSDGTRVNADYLWNIVSECMRGEGDDYVLQSFHVAHNSMPFIFGPQTSSEPYESSSSLGKLQGENAIELMGNSAQENTFQSGNEGLTQPAASQNQIQPDDVCGTWVYERYGSTLNIWKDGSGYAGQVSYTWQFDPRQITASSLNRWGPDGICLRFEFIGMDNGYAKYRGKSYEWHPNGERTWSDTELKIRTSSDPGRFKLYAPDGGIYDKR